MTDPGAPEPPPTGGATGDGTGAARAGRTLTAEEDAEYQRLRRAAALGHRRARGVGASVLLVLALLLAPAAVVAAWAETTVDDRSRYVETVAPLASDPAIQQAVTERISDEAVKNVDVEAVTDELARTLREAGAPPRVVEGAEQLAGPLRSALRSVVERVVGEVVASDAFERAWVTANGEAHDALLTVLTGRDGGVVRAEGDDVQLDLGEVVDRVRDRLVDAGFEQAAAIPDSERTITLFHAEELSRAQDTLRLLTVLGVWLPLVTLVLAALAVWAAPSHRLMLLITGLGTGLMMLVLLAALAYARQRYLDSVPPTALPADAAAEVFDTLVRFLRASALTLLVVSLITASAAYLYGPGRLARGVRSGVIRGTSAVGGALSRKGLRTGRTGRWLAGHRSLTTGVVLAAGALALVLWNYPTVGAVALVVGLVVLVLLVLAVLASAAGLEEEAVEQPAGSPL
ncbi:hypothetical protein GL263_19265 [Streptomyces durbertensis]|uniref:Integral membrane protein n=1 Tax=Streptomyces durbertensis TaxID=2448886 RepID=A0ABR6EME7_9ACTN|nr:hypothetical protein [Streptomyces durbertensis]MBB1245684.1 hypothetical protein [Streptomyces durbertensis]